MSKLTVTYEIDKTAEFVFDDKSPSWSKPEYQEYNWLFLRSQQNWANDMLRAQGYLFLNQVLHILGIPSTVAGQIVGWIPAKPDWVVDFGCWDDMGKELASNPDGSIQLKFNIQGPILHILG